ncbi:MAG: phosphoadenosine phosphosulfate reductase family protein [Pseudomonadota bacterium]
MKINNIILVSFSGGRTSAYMCKWLLDNKSRDFDLHFVFANTGLEHEKTLEFVDRCDREWGLNLTWIESVTHQEKGKGQTYNIVDFKTAARNGEPFESLVSVEGLSGPGIPRCSGRLKTIPITKYRKTLGKKIWSAVGIRVDEIDRISKTSKKDRVFYPLITMHPTTKAEIRYWFKEQSFDLEIPEHEGNCLTCWQKNLRKLLTVAKYNPEYFNFFKRMEEQYCKIGLKEGQERRYWFRGYLTVDKLISLSKEEFWEFEDHMPEQQFDLLGYDLDQMGDCGGRCEAFS